MPAAPKPPLETLRRMYCEERLGLDAIATRLRSSNVRVRQWLVEAGIPVRRPGDNGREVRIAPETLREAYVDRNMTLAEIAAALHRAPEVIARNLKEAGIPIRRSGPRPGRGKGRKPRKDASGYTLVYSPGHPHATKSGYVREHRLVVEERDGVILPPEVDVHHRDGSKSHNVPDNLEVFPSRGEHIRHHNLERSTAHRLRALTDDELRAEYRLLSSVPLAKKYGTSPATVQRELHRRGIPLRKGPR